MSKAAHEGWLDLAKGFWALAKSWPRICHGDRQCWQWICLRFLKVRRSEWIKALWRKPHTTWAVKSETLKPVESSAPRLQRGLYPLKPGSVQSFSPGHKAMPRRVSSCSKASLQLHHSLSCCEVSHCACLQVLVLCNSSSPVLAEPSQEPSESWSQSQAACLFIDELLLRGTKWNICWKRPHQTESISWVQPVCYPFWFPFWLSLCHNAVYYWWISIKQAEKYWHYSVLFLDSLEWNCLPKLPRPLVWCSTI